MAFHVLYCLVRDVRFARYLWGPDGLGAAGGAFNFAFGTNLRLYVFLAIHGVAALMLLLGRGTRAATLVLCFTTRMLGHRLPDLTDGGDNIMYLLTFYALGFVGPHERPAPNGVRVWVHNLAVSAVVAQTVIVYSTAAFYKFSGASWQNGTALYLISQVDRFSTPMFAQLMRNGFVCTMATYGTLAYQAFLPVAVFSQLRRAWLLIGISFHVGIILMMGLVPFSAIMIGLDIVLLSEEELHGLLAKARILASRLLERLPPFLRSAAGAGAR
jgi:hypothetical protein